MEACDILKQNSFGYHNFTRLMTSKNSEGIYEFVFPTIDPIYIMKRNYINWLKMIKGERAALLFETDIEPICNNPIIFPEIESHVENKKIELHHLACNLNTIVALISKVELSAYEIEILQEKNLESIIDGIKNIYLSGTLLLAMERICH